MGRLTTYGATMLAGVALLFLAGQATARTVDGQPSALKQYTSHGHVLGFDNGGYYVSNGTYALRVRFEGAAAAAPSSDDAGKEASEQQKAAPLGRVTYSGVWTGISVTYDVPAGGIARSTWTLEPGAVPAAIRLRYNRTVEIAESGELAIGFDTGAITESRPVAWQDVEGVRRAVDVEFVQLAGDLVGFRLGEYRADLSLTIDPNVIWNTFLGGSGTDQGSAIAVDGSGNVYVGGGSDATWGSPERAYTSGSDAFAAKLTSAGELTCRTFLGGSGADSSSAIAVDGSGNVYVGGTSEATWGSPVIAHTALYDGFAAKLTSAGVLTWNTFLGGSGYDWGYAIAVDDSGNVYVGGSSDATWGSPVRAYTASNDGFAAKLTSAGALTWNTFLGGSGYDQGYAIAVDGSGNSYVGGISDTTWGSPERAYTASNDGFAAKLTSAGALTWNTFLGGSGNDVGSGIAVDGSGNVYLGGYGNATWGSPVLAHTNDYDGFAAKLTPAGALTWNTFFGGYGGERVWAIAVDSSGNVYAGGDGDGPWGSPERGYTASNDAFAVKLTPAGALTWNAFLGGSGIDYGFGIAVDGGGNVIMAGFSSATWDSPERAYTAGDDAFVGYIDTLPAWTPTPTSTPTPEAGCLATPEPDCLEAGKTGFKMKNISDDANGQLKWKWKNGALAATQATFGNPVDGGTSYKLCIYDTSGGVPALKRGMVVESAGTCGEEEAPCWKAIGSKGWKYRNAEGNADGITLVLLKGGDAGKPAVMIKANGEIFTPPEPLSSSEYFDVDSEVVVQWHSSNPVNCWSQSYESANVKKNDGVQFSAQSP